MLKLTRRRLFLWPSLIPLAFSFPGCGSDDEGLTPNRRPTVELTSGPVEGDTVSYHIRVSWSGQDPDGYVTRYEYAVDPPAEFTETEIAEGGPEITEETLPGTGGAPDTTRVTKALNGDRASFDWIHTLEFSRQFSFSTTDHETTRAGPTRRFLGLHALYVRAVDDDRAASVPDHVAFTASTVAPESRIVRPEIDRFGLSLGSSFHSEWVGTDPDSPDPGQEPVGYYFNLARVDTFDHPIFIYPPPPEYWLSFGTWVYTEDTARIFDLDVPAEYAFGIKAVDENDVVEPFVERGRNFVLFITTAEGGRPTIILSCVGGAIELRFPGDVAEIEIPVDVDVACEISCSAENYGEECLEWRWGVDITDLEGEEGWSEWTSDAVLPPILFPRPGVHVLYVRARDSLGGVTTGTVPVMVVDFPFDREVLFVDDSFDDVWPRDEHHDAFWRDRFAGYGGFGQVHEFHVHGERDRENLAPQIPTLEELGRYKLLVWECRGSGYNGQTALLNAAALMPILGQYLAVGGKLWLGGRMTVAATTPHYSGTYADFTYPKEMEPGNFCYDFLKLRSTLIHNDKGSDGKHTFAAALPADPAVYSHMMVDKRKINTILQALGWVTHSDAVFDPILAERTGFRGDVDSLYYYGALGNILFNKPSTYHHRLCAVRWHDPDPDREHGRTQWFGFPLYYMYDTRAEYESDVPVEDRVEGAVGAQETFNRSMDWFREEQPPR